MLLTHRRGAALIIAVLFTSLLFASDRSKASRDDASDEAVSLTAGQTIERSLNGTGKQFYKVRAEAGKTLRFTVEQKGIDVMVTLKSEGGDAMKKTDRPSGSYGRETVTFIAARDETILVELSAFYLDAAVGSYEITFLGSRDPLAEDAVRAKAEDLTSAAEELRGQGTERGRTKAVETFTEALRLWESLGDDYEQSVTHYGIGFSEYGLSNNYQAAVSFQKALRLARGCKWLFGQAAIHSALGAAQYTMGQYGLAEFNLRRAIKIYEVMGNVRGLGIAHHGLGTVQMLEEKYADAEETLELSRSYRDRANDRSGRVLTGLSLVDLNLVRGDMKGAEQELAGVETVLGPQRVAANAQYLFFLGKVSSASGRFDAALEAFGKALPIFDREGNRLRIAQTHYEVSRTLFRQGKLSESLTEIAGATSAIEKLRAATKSYRLRVGFTSLVEPFYDHYVKVLMALHEKEPEAGHDRAAFDVSEQSRSRGLLDTLERRTLIRQSVIDPALLEQENTLRDKISLILRDWADVGSERGMEEFQDVLADYADVEARIDTQLSVPETNPIQTLKSGDIGALLSDGSVVLSYVHAEDRLYLWLFTKGSMKSYDLGPSREAMNLTSDAARCFSDRPLKLVAQPCRRESTGLGKVLLGPVADEIENNRLVIIRHGELERIPWSALVNPKTGRYLVESNESVSLPSASILGSLRRTQPKKVEGALIFADPVYSSNDGRFGGAAKRPEVRGLLNLPRLFASRFEASRIADVFPAGQAVSNTDFDASRERFLRADLKSYRILHFAAHAVVNDAEPDLSAIVLSLFDERGAAREGMIRPNDIQRVDINAELVVLSACQTGAGKEVRGEGIASLAQSFFSAGARRVLFSGWQVDDKVTAELMSRFYRRHITDGLTPSAAIRETQLSMLRDPRWSHPFYWAAFSLQGEP